MADMKNSNQKPVHVMSAMRPGGGGGKGPMRPPMSKGEKPKNAKGTFMKLIRYIGESKRLFIFLIIVMIVITLLNLAVPSIQGVAIDCITLTKTKLTIEKTKFINTLLLLGATYGLSSLLSYFQGLFSARLSQNTVRKMRHDLFDKLVRLPIRYTDTHNHGDIMSRMTNDVENISNTITSSIGSLISAILSVIGAISIMLWYSPLMTLVSLSTVVFTILISVFMAKMMKKFYVEQQTLLGKLNGHIEETVTGFKTVVAFNKQGKSKDQFDDVSNRLKNIAIKADIFGNSMGPVMNVISNIGFLLIAITGGMLAYKQVITIGVIQAFILYSKQLSRPINEIASQFADIQTAIAGAERVFDVMDSKCEDISGAESFNINDVQGHIEFRNVHFGYNKDEPVIKDFSLDVESGQKIAIVGATGSGKTTIVNLLTRFYEIDSGEILIDGKNIEDIPKNKLRKSIGIVLQDTVLFNETIANNVRYGKLNATAEELKYACETANIDSYIERLPDTYETMLTEGGNNMSQGQRQLMSIARAVLSDPKILILDEATSNVDTRTEMKIQRAMVALMKNRTSLIIAHRLSTIIDADNIIVIDDGKIVEMGSHEKLIEKQGCYFNLYRNQFAGVET